VLCRYTFPLASALRSTNSAADRSALFAGFTATMASSDFPRPCIIGFGSSPSRCGPPALSADGQTWDLPSSNAILLYVMWPWTPAERRCLASRHRSYCVRPSGQVSASAACPFRGSIPHPTQQLCTLRGRRYRRFTQHSLPGDSLRLTWAGLAPADRASFAWRLPRISLRSCGLRALHANPCGAPPFAASVTRMSGATSGIFLLGAL
jgi:hypothetical protein